jgi:hypothetical protein
VHRFGRVGPNLDTAAPHSSTALPLEPVQVRAHRPLDSRASAPRADCRRSRRPRQGGQSRAWLRPFGAAVAQNRPAAVGDCDGETAQLPGGENGHHACHVDVFDRQPPTLRVTNDVSPPPPPGFTLQFDRWCVSSRHVLQERSADGGCSFDVRAAIAREEPQRLFPPPAGCHVDRISPNSADAQDQAQEGHDQAER